MEGNHKSSKDKKQQLCFGYFCRFVSHALTLRPQNTYIYVSPALFDFCSFKATSCWFWKLGVSSLHSTLNFEKIQQDFWHPYVLVFCCAANQYSEITGFFFFFQFLFILFFFSFYFFYFFLVFIFFGDFKLKSALKGLIKVR